MRLRKQVQEVLRASPGASDARSSDIAVAESDTGAAHGLLLSRLMIEIARDEVLGRELVMRTSARSETDELLATRLRAKLTIRRTEVCLWNRPWFK